MIIFNLMIAFCEAQINISFIYENKILCQNVHSSAIIFPNLLSQFIISLKI